MNLIFILQVQDGDTRRNQITYDVLPNDSTKENINAKGEELLREYFTGDEDGEWCWDSYGETAARYYSYKIIPCDQSFEVIKEII
jgi:hypothetical protein